MVCDMMSVAGDIVAAHYHIMPRRRWWRSCRQAYAVRIYSKEISNRYDLDHTSFCSEAQRSFALAGGRLSATMAAPPCRSAIFA